MKLSPVTLVHDLGELIRSLASPESMKHWSLPSVQTKLIKVGEGVVCRARKLVFQMAKVLVPRDVFDWWRIE